MTTGITTHNLGHPRIGEHRELKKATEAYWQGRSSLEALEQTGRGLRRANWLAQREAGIDLIPSNDFSFYDQVLDMTCLAGNVPPRFEWDGAPVDLDLRFRIARGAGGAACGCGSQGALASDMTKWFDTNYHYIVPEFHPGTTFTLGSAKPFDEFAEALEVGIRTKPVLIGPVTYLTLGKTTGDFDRFSLWERLLPVYIETLRRLQIQGAEWVQIDEPILVLDLTSQQQRLLAETYRAMREAVPGLKILLATYFGDLRENLDLACQLPVNALHLDAVRAPHEVDAVSQALPPEKILSLGIVDGRNIWKNDLHASLALIERARAARGADGLMLAPSCSLLHVPVTLRNEARLDSDFRGWLSFAREKLDEVVTLARHASGDYQPFELRDNQTAIHSRRASARTRDTAVRERCESVTSEDARRGAVFAERQKLQRAKLGLPLFPTTTIGSFPQTAEVRAARARWKKGELPGEAYDRYLEAEIAKTVRLQEEIGIDMLVHGEFERNDMVEYFGEQLEGFAFTQNGWVQSYGSRCVKPPVIFGDVSRPHPMTVRWSSYAQSLTSRPMKGMLTGPITMLQWSFVRDDLPRRDIARQIALALRDEVADLEKAGIAAIQIDEPALREGLPLRRGDWQDYLDWAVEAFRLCASGVKDGTQIHTHMCYSEFNDIIASIAALDADVISIETSRSSMELLDAFVSFKYPYEIGPGVWDIHSPRIPEADEMIHLLRKAADVLPPENLWVNPDCGLKTRGWKEVVPALKNLAAAARAFREELARPNRQEQAGEGGCAQAGFAPSPL